MQDRFKLRYYDEKSKKIYDVCFVGFDIPCVSVVLSKEEQLHIGSRSFKWENLIRCTGLKDKNGKLIYEGDIVKFAEYDWTDFSFKDWEQQKAVVIWGGDYDYPAFDLKGTDFDGTNGLSYIFGEGWTIEVIGNIYKNPKLLEVEQ